jgi:hypothetical protein
MAAPLMDELEEKGPVARVCSTVADVVLGPFVLCYCLFSMCFGCVGAREGKDTKEAKREEQAKQDEKRAEEIRAWREERRNLEPPPLPTNRRPLSSIPIHRPAPAEQCALLRLPLEIRRQIITEVLGKSVIHLVQRPNRLGHFLCSGKKWRSAASHAKHPFYDSSRRCFHLQKVPQYHHNEPLDPHLESDGCLALAKTCRQIYREAMDILYTTNTFDVNHPQTLIFLARTIRPQRLSSIRSLQITWSNFARRSEVRDVVSRDGNKYPDDLTTWEDMWDIVGSQMKGLVDLKLKLEMHAQVPGLLPMGPIGKQQLQLLLQAPRKQVRGLRNFQLDIGEATSEARRLEGDMRELLCVKQSI